MVNIEAKVIKEKLQKIVTLFEENEPNYTKITREVGKLFLSCCMRDENTANALASIGAALRTYCEMKGISVNYVCLKFMDIDYEGGEHNED